MLDLITIVSGTLVFLFVMFLFSLLLTIWAMKTYGKKLRGYKIKYKNLTQKEKNNFKDSEHLKPYITVSGFIYLLFIISWIVWLITIIF